MLLEMFKITAVLAILAITNKSTVFGLQCYNSDGWNKLETDQNKTNCENGGKCVGAWFTGNHLFHLKIKL